jgi:Na+-translocating ferredoxin:NAD+ oxidoreductase subunit D
MSDITIVQQTSPHLRRKDTLAGMMIDVLIALLPVIIYSIVIYTWRAAVNMLLAVATMSLCEFIYVLIKNRLPVDGNKHTLKEQFLNGVKAYDINNFLCPAISGILFAMVLPAKATSPEGYIYFIIVIGSIFGMVIGKLVFGGTGHNIFNPAIVGFIFTKECFGSFYRGYLSYSTDLVTSGTFLGNVSSSNSYLLGEAAYGKYSLLELFLGTGTGAMGTMGETCKLAILLGLAYLLVRRTVDWRVVVSYLGTFVVLMLLAGIIVQVNVPAVNAFQFMLYQLLSGGVLFGATYMVTDPVTMPITRPSRVMYGMIAAVATVFIRLFVNGYNYVYEGVAFSILIANMFAPVLDYYKWSTNKYTWKNLLAMGLIAVVAIVVVLWALSAKVTDALASSSNSSGSVTSASGNTTSTDVSGGGSTKGVIALFHATLGQLGL